MASALYPGSKKFCIGLVDSLSNVRIVEHVHFSFNARFE